MAYNPRTPRQGNTLAAASLLVLAGLFAAPGLAAPQHDVLSADSHEATLDVADTALVPVPVNANKQLLEDHLLKPRVEATAREIFSDDTDPEAEEEAETETDELDAEPTVPGLSDGQPRPYRRQMYRRDI